MDNKNTITVIVPVHNLNTKEKDYFATAISSIEKQKVLPNKIMIVVANNKELISEIQNFSFGEKIKDLIKIEINEGETDFASQINYGVSKIDTEFFSVLELDDEYSMIWFDNALKYIDSYPDQDMYLPIVLDVNTDGNFLHFTNEAVWARDFSDKMGHLDNDALLNFPSFQFSGSVIRKDAYESVGGLKSSIRLQFIYEFFLRMTYYDKKIMTVPKLGYKKVNMRPDSLFWGYYNLESERIDPIEARFWYNLSRKESYFKTDRKIKYEKEIATPQ